MTEKGPDAFRTISEVADDLDVPQHVLRFWETRFSQIKPMKRGGGRRYYRPDDVDLLRGIRKLLYGDGYTIKGVQRILKEHGVRHVIGIGAARNGADTAVPAAIVDVPSPAASPAEPAGQGPATHGEPPRPAVVSPAPVEPPRAPQFAPPQPVAPTPPPAAPQAVPPAAPADTAPLPGLDSLRVFAVDRVAPQTEAPAEPAVPAESKPEPASVEAATPEPVAPPPAASQPAPPVAVPAVGSAGQALTPEDIRRLQAALYELSECRQTLTEALKR